MTDEVEKLAKMLNGAVEPHELEWALGETGLALVEVEMLRQVFGMAREGCHAPGVGYRWCERIDEVFFQGPMFEYKDYALDLPPRPRAASLTEGDG